MSTVTPQHLSNVMDAIVNALKEDSELKDMQINVSRSEPANDDLGQCPWVGVYKRGVSFNPRTIPLGWRQEIEFVIWAQHTSMKSGADAEDNLNALVFHIIRVLLSDPGLRTTVQMTNRVSTKYNYEDVREGDVYFQHALITIIGETHTTLE